MTRWKLLVLHEYFMTSRDHRKKINEHTYAKGLAKKKKINFNEMSFDIFFFKLVFLSAICKTPSELRQQQMAVIHRKFTFHPPSVLSLD